MTYFEEMLDPLEATICSFLKTLLDKDFQSTERNVVPRPVRFASQGIFDPTKRCSLNYERSSNLTKRTQGQLLSCSNDDILTNQVSRIEMHQEATTYLQTTFQSFYDTCGPEMQRCIDYIQYKCSFAWLFSLSSKQGGILLNRQ